MKAKAQNLVSSELLSIYSHEPQQQRKQSPTNSTANILQEQPKPTKNTKLEPWKKSSKGYFYITDQEWKWVEDDIQLNQDVNSMAFSLLLR